MKKEKKVKGVFLLKEIVESSAFRDLNATSVFVYLDFMLKRKMVKREMGKREGWSVLNDGRIVYPYTEAKQRGIPSPTFTRAIDDLVEHGFIDIHESGVGVEKKPTLYGFSERWREWGTDRFVERPRGKQPLWRKGIGFGKEHDFYPRKGAEACGQHT